MHKVNSGSRSEMLAMSAIGVIHTPFTRAAGTPIQAAGDEDTHGVVELLPELVPGLRDLAEFERLWLIYLLDRASEAELVVRPYMDAVEHGIFATRSPARPNHIGLSAVRLFSVEANRLLIAGVDMLDGTPLLDIKPYVPSFDCFEVKRIGWYQGKPVRGAVADDRFEAHTRDSDHA